MLPRVTELLLIGWFHRINLDPKIQIKYIDTENQPADILTKGSFKHDEWNRLLCLFDISHFSSTVCSAALAKLSQQDSGEERVTAKSKPMMNLTARTPSSVSPVKRYYGKQDPWKSVVAENRSGQPDRETESFSSTDYSRLDYDRAWSSQEWKTEVTTHDRSRQPDKAFWRMVQQVRPHHEATLLDGTAHSVRYGEPVRDRSGQPDNVNSQEAAQSQKIIMGSDATEFVNRVNDEVRKRHKRMSNVAGEREEHSIIW